MKILPDLLRSLQVSFNNDSSLVSNSKKLHVKFFQAVV